MHACSYDHTHHRMSPQLNNEQMIERDKFIPTTIAALFTPTFVSVKCEMGTWGRSLSCDLE